MSRTDVEDREFGKGRRNASSSPESSPRQKKRSFSPTSDDGDLVVPPIADDDTPPPPDHERPLIRQAMGFGSAVAAPPSLNTYGIVLPSAIRSPHDTLFLPGQEVTLSTKSTRRRTKPTGPSRKKKKKNDYGGQTTRFRLDPHIGSTSSEPVPQHSPLPASISGISVTPTPSAPSLAHTLTSSYGGDNIPPALQFPSVHAISTFASQSHPMSATQPILSVSGRKITDPPLAEGPSRLSLNDPSSPPHTRSPVSEITRSSDRYYRRDYDKNPTFYEPEASHAFTNHSSGQPSGVYEDAGSSVRAGAQPPLPTTHRHHEERIKDIRSGEIDHQLAEVKVPMKVANDPKDGFWADAKIIGQQLQSSASRIDGPARVYTLRGKYRQFFLRVSADNRDEFISTHLAIKPDKVLDVVVEELLPPGQLPQPPKIPRDLIARSPSPGSTSESLSSERDSIQPQMRSYELIMKELEMYRRRHGSFQYSPSPEPIARRGRKSWIDNGLKHKQSPDRRSSSAESIPSALIPSGVRFKSPDLDDPLEEVDRLITEVVDQIVQEEEEWTAFFRARAAHEPHRAMDVLKQYKIVKRMLDTFVGKKVPFKSFKAKIEPALKIEDVRFSSDCVETLRLLDLYGENGRHYTDPRVIEMVKDTSTPEYNAKPIKRLLHLMQDIDKKWKEEHSSAES
ncbi:hypothetical protein C0995_007456 [Termitomyces sp. Mi166|nr:hypothetical protein C0995_007456 [Termitomyces sp. Mi166\